MLALSGPEPSMRRSKRQFDLQIASPCTQSWSEMTGGASQRHCAYCKKLVHNFAVMTPRQIERAIAENEGHLCARVTKLADGTLITAQELASSGFAVKAATLLLGAALSTAATRAQSNPGEGMATVSGRFTAPDGTPPASQAYVVFVEDGQSKLEIKTDTVGNWKAEIEPGTYDVIFKTGPIFGERVNAVQLHSGEQEFASVRSRFALGHLGIFDHSGQEEYATVGEVTGTYRYPVSYLFKHPIRYLKHLPHNFS